MGGTKKTMVQGGWIRVLIVLSEVKNGAGSREPEETDQVTLWQHTFFTGKMPQMVFFPFSDIHVSYEQNIIQMSAQYHVAMQ